MNQPFSVLLVEDNLDARRNLEDILALDHYQVRGESDCQAALEAVAADSFDVVIVDWKLPDANADQLLPKIAEHLPDTPVVVITGMRDFETALSALRNGAYDFLLKPINPDALRSVLWRVMERKKHLAAIEEAQERLLQSERLAAIGQMVTGLAHESRNAFQRSHACLAELSLDLEDKPESLGLVHKVQRALDDLHRMLEEVRDYSAPVILEKQPCSIAELIQRCWNRIGEAKPGQQRPEFSMTVAPELAGSCWLDVARIEQVLRNLLENASFAAGGSGHVNVSVNTAVNSMPGAPERLQIVVDDDGEGVPESDRESIFAPFFTTKTKGTGLGLAICQRYVEAHRGRLTVGDNPAGGARFTMDLPLETR